MPRVSWRVGLLTAVFALSLSVPVASAAAPIALAGTNIIAAGTAAYVDVRVPRTVTLQTPFGGGPHISVGGSSVLTAFVMVGTDPATRGITLAGGEAAVSGHEERFLMPVPEWPNLGGGTYEDLKTFGDTMGLPAGRYRLYSISSTKGTVVLRLPGLSGLKNLRPARRVSGSVRPPDHELSGHPANSNVFAASDIGKLGRRGFAIQVLLSRLESETAWQLVMCHHNPAAVVEPLRDAPGCPAGEKHTLVNHRYPDVTPTTRLFVQAYAGLPAGEHGLSTIYTSESYATAIGYSTLWLEY